MLDYNLCSIPSNYKILLDIVLFLYNNFILSYLKLIKIILNLGFNENFL